MVNVSNKVIQRANNALFRLVMIIKKCVNPKYNVIIFYSSFNIL